MLCASLLASLLSVVRIATTSEDEADKIGAFDSAGVSLAKPYVRQNRGNS